MVNVRIHMILAQISQKNFTVNGLSRLEPKVEPKKV